MRSRFRVIVPVIATLVVALAFVSPGASASVPEKTKPTGDITVSAASSLTEAFTAIGKQFEKTYKGTHVTFNFDASSALVLQIQGGAPVDVFASADEANMDKLVTGGQVTTKPVDFAENKLEIAVKPGNPEKVRTLADLANVGIVSLCAPEVPCGKYADAALAASRCDDPAGQDHPRHEREGDPHSRLGGRRRRGDRLRHRRQGCRILRHRGPDPELAEPDRHLSDRTVGERGEPDDREGVREVRCVACRREDPQEVRLPPRVTRH